jgi:hypothetical protein
MPFKKERMMNGKLHLSTRTVLMRHLDLVSFGRWQGKKRTQHRSVDEVF